MDEKNVESVEAVDGSEEVIKPKNPYLVLKIVIAVVVSALMFISGYFVGAAVGNDVDKIVNPKPKPNPTSTRTAAESELKISEPFPIELEEAGVDPDNMAEVRGGKIHYYNGGSSSCAPTLEKASIKEDGTYLLEYKKYPNQMCTADYATFGQTVERADGEDIPKSARVEVR